MKLFMLSLGLFACLTFGLFADEALARDLTWTRNTEPDMSHYRMWLCKTAGCSVVRSGNTPFATIPQPPVGVIPSIPLPDDLAGDAAVDAVDLAGNASALSNHVGFLPVPLDLPPLAPVGLSVK